MFRFAIVVVLAVAMVAQTITAALEGEIHDSTGAVVPGARIQILNTDTGVITRLTSGADGRYVAPSLPPGPYSVIVEATGVKKNDRTGIVLQVNQTARVDVMKEVGAITETV